MSAWKRTLYVVWFTQLLSLMGFGFGLPFLPYYIQEMGMSDPQQLKVWTGLLSAAPAIPMGLMAPIWGMLADRYGRKLMLMRAMGAAVLVLFGMGLAQTPMQLLVMRFCQGLFTGTISSANALVASQTPDRRMSMALGLLSSSTFIGFSLGPAAGGLLAHAVGYRASFMMGSALMLLGLLLLITLVREAKPDPQAAGSWRSMSLGSFKQVLNPLVLLLLVVLFCLRISRSAVAPYLPLYVQELRGIEGSAAVVGMITGLGALASATSGLVLGRLGDKRDRLRLLRLCLLFGALISLPLLFIQGLGGFSIFYLSALLLIGGVEPVISSLTTRHTPAAVRGTLFGLQGMVSSAGWVVSPAIGSVVAIQLSTRYVFALLPIMLILALIPAWRATKRGRALATQKEVLQGSSS